MKTLLVFSPAVPSRASPLDKEEAAKKEELGEDEGEDEEAEEA